MKTGSPDSYVVVGDETLTQICCEKILQRGSRLLGVVSSDEFVTAWCESSNTPLLAWDDLGDLEFDFLLSIANLKLIPQRYLELAKVASVNFHDGPLPEYRGLNTPVWALVNGEDTHAITWHSIHPTYVDEGPVLVSRNFPVDPDETALSLNTKCFDEAIRSFDALLDILEGDAVMEVPASKSRSETGRHYFSYDKPGDGGWIDWSSAADSIAAMIRALDFGSYPNPLCLPKFTYQGRIIFPQSSSVLSEHTQGEPGTVVSIADNQLQVITGDRDILITKMVDVNGEEVRLLADLGIQPDDELGRFSEDQRRAFKENRKALHESERYWTSVYRNSVPLEFPFAEIEQDQIVTTKIASGSLGEAKSVGAILTYLASIAREDAFDVMVDDPWKGRFGNLASASSVETVVPLQVTRDWSLPIVDWLAKIEGGLEDIVHKAPPSTDLPLRLGLTGAKLDTVAVCIHLGGFDSGRSHSKLGFWVNSEDGTIELSSSHLDREMLNRIGRELAQCISQLAPESLNMLGDIDVLLDEDRKQMLSWNHSIPAEFDDAPIHVHFQNAVQTWPEDVAVACGVESLTYRALEQKANRVSRALIARGVESGNLVGINVHRSHELPILLLAVLKSGAAYVPLDPTYPEERIVQICKDSDMSLLITDDPELVAGTVVCEASDLLREAEGLDDTSPDVPVLNSDLMYVIFTSGSTGRPKGVKVTHRNVANLIGGIDDLIGKDRGVFLSTTSISFDISVLEIFWSLGRGFKLVIQEDESAEYHTRFPERPMEFGLFYWNIAHTTGDSPYDLLLKGAKYGDENGFHSIWTPERHFGDFGGIYPNPAVTSAAIAACTSRIAIRAGSCVLPLHHPIRVAEDWSIVDNISGGRVGISVASGWMPNDFVIKPENFANAKEVMFESVQTLRSLWRGDTVEFDGPTGKVAVKTLPRPVQKELPVWVTTAGSIETYQRAAEIGANILTHLLGQSIDEVSEKVAEYRSCWDKAGHSGKGKVTLMLHTFVGDSDENVKEIVREPLKQYLRSALSLVREAAFQFPTFQKFSEEGERTLEDFFESAPEEEVDEILEFAFERYFQSNGLMGGIEKCVKFVDDLKHIDIDEIGCLIDFGVSDAEVLEHLPQLKFVMELSNSKDKVRSPVENIYAHGVTHFQCTPSMISLLAADESAKQKMGTLRSILVGGEPVTQDHVVTLNKLSTADVYNMYGPTESTVWSTARMLDRGPSPVFIGRPLKNTSVLIADALGRSVPLGVAGELLISGEGVTQGYLAQDELTHEKFAPVIGSPEIWYRTGDLVRQDMSGNIKFLGRMDNQVKVRGYRIELEEIQRVALESAGVIDSIALVVGEDTTDATIALFLVLRGELDEAGVRQTLESRLPPYMLPSRIISLDRFPLLPNGKLDRVSLLESVNRARRIDIVAPSSDSEKLVERIWASVTSTQELSIYDNFFDVGGHSLSAIQAIAMIEEASGTRLTPKAILTSTLGDLAKMIDPNLGSASVSDGPRIFDRLTTVIKRFGSSSER